MTKSVEVTKENKAELRTAFKSWRKPLAQWQKDVEQTAKDHDREVKLFYEMWEKKEKANKDTEVDDWLCILTARSHQFSETAPFILDYVRFLLDLSEKIVLDSADLSDTDRQLAKKLRDKKKVELHVPKHVGYALNEWVKEREYSQRRWKAQNR